MEPSIKNHTPPADQQAATDFFQGDLEAGLERIRLRLLDLTNRNRLLNFRHTKRSSLRVVDELPDQLFDVLADGKDLRFKPVPQPRRKDWIGTDDNGAGAESALAREPTPGRIREPQRRLPTAREYAESLGIPTSFDLPRPQPGSDGIVVARHADREIQTLHYPDELEAILRSIASSARLAIEETGTNMLYLAMGFLEWYDSEDSDKERLAPLLLVPVSLERGAPDAQTQAYRYSIRRSGEDIVANISLQEKLRRDFYLEVPEVEEEDAPESYFRKVERIIGGHERWRVRRQITLTLLSFGKALMYRDLDPGTWPNDGGPAQHPRIREFFEGIQQKEITIAPDYRIDDPRLSDRVPLLIDDADSSQHSALVDAMRGKNLVIQGPPGTGKSQTITNLIAAAMAAGKTVLFVSEKLAALEVVRDRLNRAGLGTFCLELHSHKTRKRALLDDLEARIDARNTFVVPGSARSKDRLSGADEAASDRVRRPHQYWIRPARPHGLRRSVVVQALQEPPAAGCGSDREAGAHQRKVAYAAGARGAASAPTRVRIPSGAGPRDERRPLEPSLVRRDQLAARLYRGAPARRAPGGYATMGSGAGRMGRRIGDRDLVLDRARGRAGVVLRRGGIGAPFEY